MWFQRRLCDLSIKVGILGGAIGAIVVMASIGVIGLDTVRTMQQTFNGYASGSAINSLAASWRGEIAYFQLLGRTYLASKAAAGGIQLRLPLNHEHLVYMGDALRRLMAARAA